MCLRVKYDRKSGRKTGYKLLHIKTYGGFETGQCAVGRVTLTTKSYTTDPNMAEEISAFADVSYPAGFHIFLSSEAARRVQRNDRSNLVLCKVGFKDEVAYGKVKWMFTGRETFRTATVVARRCKILEVLK